MRRRVNLRPDVVEFGKRNSATLIFLHDDGSNGRLFYESFAATLKNIRCDVLLPGTRFVLPHAAFSSEGPAADSRTSFSNHRQSSTSLGRHQWFSAQLPGGPWEQLTDQEWMDFMEEVRYIRDIVEEEAKKVGRGNVFLVGQGTGFAVAAALVIQMERPMGGLFGVAGYMPFLQDFKSLATCTDIVGTSPEAPIPDVSSPEESPTQRLPDAWINEDIVMGNTPTPQSKMETDFAQLKVASTSTAKPKHLDASVEQDDHIMFKFGCQPSAPIMLQRLSNFLRSQLGEAPIVAPSPTSLTPVLMVHGPYGQRVDFTRGKEASEMMRKVGFPVRFRVVNEESHNDDSKQVILATLLRWFMDAGMGTRAMRQAIGDHVVSQND